MTAPARRRRLSLRIAGLSLALLLVIQTVSLLLIRRSIEANARESLQQALAQGEGVLRSLLASNADHLLQASRVLAADYGFRSAIASDDRETIASALANHGERLGATVMLLTDARFRVKASAGPVDAATLQARLLPQVRRSAEAGAVPEAPGDDLRSGEAHIALLDGEPYQVVAVPVRAPLVVGYVLMGFPVQDELLAEMRRLTSLDVVLMTREPGQPGWRTPHATLPAGQAAVVRAQAAGVLATAGGGLGLSGGLSGETSADASAATARAAASQAAATLQRVIDTAAPSPGGAPLARAAAAHTPAASGPAVTVDLDGQAFLGRPVVLRRADGADPQPLAAAVLLRSVDAAVAPYQPLQWAILLLTGVGVAVFALGSLLTARRITTPLSTLGTLARRVAAGDYGAPLPASGDDEVLGLLLLELELH